jgi:hypothetical protein
MNKATKTSLKYIDSYLDGLEKYTKEQFEFKSAPTVWSLQEMYSHITYSSVMSFIAAKRCAEGTKNTGEGLTFAGKLIFFFNMYPPFKIKAPKSVKDKTPILTIEESKKEWLKLKDSLIENEQLILNADPKNRIKHPLIGGLNGKHWYKFVPLHLYHHLQQKNRLDKLLPN